MKDTADAPWLRTSELNIPDLRERLSTEIEAFDSYIKPTRREQKNRDRLLEIISLCISDMWPGAVIEPFGSYVTGLLLPGSDVDMNISVSQPKAALKTLSKRLRAERLFRYEEMMLIQAKVPVLTIEDWRLQTSIDITLNNESSSSQRTERWLQEYPPLRILFLILKHALSSLVLDALPTFQVMSAKTNGLASYSLICLLVFYFQQYKYLVNDTSSKTYYADLLLGFLTFYAKFDFENMCIVLKDGAKLIPKSQLDKSAENCSYLDKISIEDPDRPGINVARSSNRIDYIRGAFSYLETLLRRRINAIDPRNPESVLSAIIKVRPHHARDPRPSGRSYRIGIIEVPSEIVPFTPVMPTLSATSEISVTPSKSKNKKRKRPRGETQERERKSAKLTNESEEQ
ncbi:uncharacterized protein BYT42DRAFT_570764 [Radiomyces spectabilis]|uniref:uncharacterized protein n=1 Tax=Radiomyces spectabilis TaxID=64574 RepID=UPI00221FFBD1|nr:uncharacterized protein BYT42DRAFT_570764 [Radiomyces spectabilis]KAI8377570.1 hypothetical protein BYT42DRAFT_570764 [Radiomyces spectabilis]